MVNLLAAATALGSITLGEVVACRTFWACLVGAIGLWLVVPRQLKYGKGIGIVLIAIAGGLLASDLPLLGLNNFDGIVAQGIFWMLALIAIGSAVGTIASQSPVYSAIWFALSLLGTSGLYFYQGAEFLGVATIVVYAGAIVVTFLFVIMLAQPSGHSDYDRISWGSTARLLSVVAAATFVGLFTMLLGGLKTPDLRQQVASNLKGDSEIWKDRLVELEAAGQPVVASVVFRGTKPPEPELEKLTADVAQSLRLALATRGETTPEQVELKLSQPTFVSDVQDRQHVASLGRYLFSRHLVSVEVAGSLLLVALVGAIAMAIQGKARKGESEDAA